MPVEDIILRSIDEPSGHMGIEMEKVLRLRVVRDTLGKIDGDKLFVDIMRIYEDNECQVQTRLGHSLEWHEEQECETCAHPEQCVVPSRPTLEQAEIGSFTFQLDEVIAALNLLKNHGN